MSTLINLLVALRRGKKWWRCAKLPFNDNESNDGGDEGNLTIFFFSERVEFTLFSV